ncbi:CRISPR-associated helicase Cas3' [Myxococcota bacterium]|nr:CRISPR-associated helicase Cas3' [Myxococcota bacterium]MBU1410077.1 CRISPR-associated helicase Cas3' [Myxococcota bacterium]MBU1512179.1 CRISPR-associated helicase Cas3' [Myxococcota bacterium]
MTDFYAHSLPGVSDLSQWQTLEDHLHNVGELAGQFAAKFGCEDWGRLAGLLHDLGKTSSEFQARIRASAGNEEDEDHRSSAPKRPHATDGAIYAVEKLGLLGRILAYLVAGHHAGLPDWEDEGSSNASLRRRLLEEPRWDQTFAREGVAPTMKTPSGSLSRKGTEMSLSIWMRMLFSCLVDADFLDTEAFMAPGRADRRGHYRSLAELSTAFEPYMAKKCATAPSSQVNTVRAEILDACECRAPDPQGLFSLTVPTGGGKTLSSMAFALRHAQTHGLERVIYVIPYTSIIEQTADQFRGIFGDDVLEHHSNLDSPDDEAEDAPNRLASENWDAPIIVTTSVQFFESLFASRTSRCRKLHNIVGSVVILDEAQLLPPDFLNPILLALQELVMNYRVSVVFSTATQPAFEPRKGADFDFHGLPEVRELMPDPLSLYRRLERTRLSLLRNLKEPMTWEELAAELAAHPTVLCIVNRRDDARALWERMPVGTFHLSALMCGAHRSECIAQIKQRLKDGETTQVVSTQLVEAGVDFDFPVVYRAVAGLDSVAQAAGRCNREGRLEAGKVHVFEPPSKTPVGILRQAAEVGRSMMTQHGERSLAPERFREFFGQLYWLRGDRLDRERIISLLPNEREIRIQFRTAAEKFRLIDSNAQLPVIVNWRDGGKWIHCLRQGPPDRWLLRKLQRYVVNIPKTVHGRLLREHAIVEVHPGIYVQEQAGLYREDLGLCPDLSCVYDPEDLIIS